MNKKIEHKIIDGIEFKWCGSCNNWLTLDNFGKFISRWDSLYFQCKNCRKSYDAIPANREHKRVYTKNWRLANPGYTKRPTLARSDPKRRREQDKEQRKKYPEKYKEKARRAGKKRYLTLKGRLHTNVSRAIAHCLKGSKGGKHTFDILGYTSKQLIKRLMKTMPDGYTWNDYLLGKLHLDHIIPISVFNLKKPEDRDFKRCWALSNLQLLPVIENIKKSNKLERPFQPSLIFLKR